eukprot:scaffold209622_cov26-Tisochrysis_lutea.AAC.2
MRRARRRPRALRPLAACFRRVTRVTWLRPYAWSLQAPLSSHWTPAASAQASEFALRSTQLDKSERQLPARVGQLSLRGGELVAHRNKLAVPSLGALIVHLRHAQLIGHARAKVGIHVRARAVRRVTLTPPCNGRLLAGCAPPVPRRGSCRAPRLERSRLLYCLLLLVVLLHGTVVMHSRRGRATAPCATAPALRLPAHLRKRLWVGGCHALLYAQAVWSAAGMWTMFPFRVVP